MSTIHVEVTGIIDAPPERVYAVLADYRDHHPNILPKPYFTGLRVEEGGVGAGTVAVADMDVYGTKRSFRLTVTEPQPGRVLAESDAAAGMVTTFTVEPLEGGAKSRVTIATDTRPSPGLRGWIERLVNPSITRRIYHAELQQLNAYLARLQD
jgi:hypothetical protein